MSSDTTIQLLDVAQRLVQQRGFNAFSYKDLAAEVGIRTASIHYHFPSKGDLGLSLLERYRANLESDLALIDSSCETQLERLERFSALHRSTEREQRICLCGSFASDAETLDDGLRAQVEGYVTRCEGWVAGVVRSGQRAGEFRADAKPTDLATALVSGLQGALLVSRARGGSSAVVRVKRALLGALRAD